MVPVGPVAPTLPVDPVGPIEPVGPVGDPGITDAHISRELNAIVIYCPELFIATYPIPAFVAFVVVKAQLFPKSVDIKTGELVKTVATWYCPDAETATKRQSRSESLGVHVAPKSDEIYIKVLPNATAV